jgi:hypothetical protein
MAQLFQPRANAVAHAVIASGALLVVGASASLYEIGRSDYWTGVGEPLSQPVPFSHKHHVAGLGIDCRYCHTSVEKSSFAGLPSTEICMTCHSQIWKDAPVLQPLRDSMRTGRPLRWSRVYDLPDYVFFDHSIHASKGVGCADCHGRVDQMPVTWKTQPLFMRWCLDCHRHPETRLRPRGEVFNLAFVPPKNQDSIGRELAKKAGVRNEGLTDCYTCHR